MRKMRKVGTGMLAIPIIILLLVVMPVPAVKLATPMPVSPPNNQHFFYQSARIGLYWNPVSGANRYLYSIERYNGSDWNVVDFDMTGNKNYYSGSFQVPPLTGKYRWHIIATDTTGENTASNPSAWRTFDFPSCAYTTYQLATPVLVTPTMNTVLKGGPPQNLILTWKPVPGANAYSVAIERYDVSTKKWLAYNNSAVTGCLSSYFVQTCTLLCKYRWQVKAVDTTGLYSDSSWSKWNVFTLSR